MPASTPAPATVPEADVDRLRLVTLRLGRLIRTSSSSAVTPSQLTVLVTLSKAGPLTVGQIADREQIRPPSASKIVAALEQSGFVTRTVSPTDRRYQPIALTDAGTDYLAEARRAGRSFLVGRLGELDRADVGAITGALPALERLVGMDE